MKKRLPRISFILILALSVLLSACGDSAQNHPGPGSSASAADHAESTESSFNKDDSTASADEDGKASSVDEGGNTSRSVTLMIYMTGSDLESGAAAATGDMREMAESGFDTDKANLLIYTGGSEMWHSDVPSDSHTLFRLTGDTFEKIETFGPLSMGEPESLTRFLTYSYENFPADSYDLILWDHGNGPVMGYGSDRQYGGDSLTLPELREALENSPFGGTGKDLSLSPGGERTTSSPDAASLSSSEGAGSGDSGQKLSLIGFDACLMASAELMCVTADYADYLVASEEIEPSFGWNYSFLKDCAALPARDLCQAIVEEYVTYCEDFFKDKEFFQSDVTLAAMDLAKTRPLIDSLETLFQKAESDISGDYNKLALARIRSHGIGRASTGSEYDLVDLKSLMGEMEARYPKETAAVLAAVGDAVFASRSTVPDCCGLSLFYPYYNKNYYRAKWREEYAGIGVLPSYCSFLTRYEQVWLGTDLKEVFNGKMQPQRTDRPSTYTMQLTDEQRELYASGAYYILRRDGDGIYAVQYMSTDVTENKGLLSANFDGNIIYASNDYGTRIIPVTRMWDTVDGVTNYTCPGIIGQKAADDSDTKTCEVQLSANRGTGEVTVKGFYVEDTPEGEIASGKKEAIDPAKWHTFSFYAIRGRYLTRDEDGFLLPYWDWPEGGWITWHDMAVSNGLHFTYEPLYDDGREYYIMFNIHDVQGNEYNSELLPITLAPAPDTAPAETELLTWTEGNEFPLAREDEYSIYLTMAASERNGTPFLSMRTENHMDAELYVTLADVTADRTISAASGISAFTEAGTVGHTPFTSLHEACALAGTASPHELSFILTVKRQDTGAYLVHEKPVLIEIGEDVRPSPVRLPFMGAAADAQELFNEEGLTAELTFLGEYLSTVHAPGDTYSTLSADFHLTNASASPKDVTLAGLTVNGIFFDKESAIRLGPGEEWITRISIPKNILSGVVEGSFDEQPERMTSISDIKAVFLIDGQARSCPVALAASGDAPPIVPDGEILFQNEHFEIRLDEYKGEKEYTDYFAKEGDPHKTTKTWNLWVVNRTDGFVQVRIKDGRAEEGELLNGVSVGPSAAVLAEVPLLCTEELPDSSGSAAGDEPDSALPHDRKAESSAAPGNSGVESSAPAVYVEWMTTSDSEPQRSDPIPLPETEVSE